MGPHTAGHLNGQSDLCGHTKPGPLSHRDFPPPSTSGPTADAPWPLEADTPAAALPAEAAIVSSAEWLRFDRCVKRLKRCATGG